MTEKRVSVRLAAVGGRQVRAELEGVGEAGKRGFGRLSREMEAANARLAAFSRRVRVASAAGVAMVRSGLQTVDAQAKLAQSLGTTVASLQTLERAGELAGVSMSGIEQATKDLTRRLSQAASETGPAADALDRLGLSATDLIALPLDERVGAINAAIENFVPAAERAAVAGQLFGEEGSIAMSRIDTATLRQATADVLAFGVVVSEQDADQIERTNDALSRLGLVWRGLSNQLAVAAAPALEAVAEAMATVASTTGPLGMAIRGLFDNIGRLASIAGTFAAFMASRWVAGLAAAALSVRGLATALVLLRGALIRTGIGALIVGAGELVFQFGKLVSGAGSFGAALGLVGDVARAVWDGISATLASFLDDFRAMGADIEGVWSRLMAFLSGKWADFLGQIAPGFNAVAERVGSDTRIDAVGAQAYASMLENAAGNRGTMADRFRERAAGTRGSAFDGVRDAMDALRAAMTGPETGDDGALEAAAVGADRVTEALEQAEMAAKGAGAAGKQAGTDTAEGADEALNGWQAVTAALGDYATKARETGRTIGAALVSAFKGAEDALVAFVAKGKLDFAGLADAMLADITRIAVQSAILGPLATALGGAFGGAAGGGGLLAGLFHSGGVVGETGAARMMPAAALAMAPRYHSGGMAGLRPDEVPAILQRGEMVLSRAQLRAMGREERGGGNASDRPVHVVFNITTPDAGSFRLSQGQIMADARRAMTRAGRNT
ncbi:phage tail tape measure C-terminal domain-containing protein [Meridianimarinicoccus sp. RP-17]|uniref:phage tail tape measure C-terminal domain-containing protein n=1 Tax=Meridianimarinicoccus zhengii TaxID=2056810 RepID=UPI000DAD162E|nr:phage tail tape measure C-terminal domain-containing protein [Phycocomes zhengii]